MRQTFESLLLEADHSCDNDGLKYTFTEVLNLLVMTREQTLKECAKVCNELQDTSTFSGWIDESLFLDLDKNSIEI